LPNAGLLTVEDAETGELLELGLRARSRPAKYAETNAQRLDELEPRTPARRRGHVALGTGEAFAQTLQTFFETRRGRRRG